MLRMVVLVVPASNVVAIEGHQKGGGNPDCGKIGQEKNRRADERLPCAQDSMK
jgi:hypothetical protein